MALAFASVINPVGVLIRLLGQLAIAWGAKLGLQLLGARLVALAGPIGIAITLIAILLPLLMKTAKQSEALTKAQDDLTKMQDEGAATLNRLATAQGKAREEAIKLAKAQRDQARAALVSARANVAAARAAAMTAIQGAEDAKGLPMNALGTYLRVRAGMSAKEKTDEYQKFVEVQQGLTDQFAELDAGISAAEAAGNGSVNVPDLPGKKKKGRDADRDEANFKNEVGRLRVAELEARADLTEGIEARYKATMAGLAEERASAIRDWSVDKGLNAAKRAQLLAVKGSGDADRNTYQTLVTVLSGAGPIDAIEASFADKQKLIFSGKAETGKFKDWIWEDRQLGACPEARTLQTGIGNKPGWTATSKLSGLAGVMNTLHYDSKGKGTFMTEPAMLWVIRGVRCYDPRLDSTYPGGAGPQRLGDQSTWAISYNPYVAGLTWAIGWRQNGIRVAGVGLDPATIDIGSYVAAANIADLNGWTLGGEVSTRDDKWEVLKLILQAGGGEPIREGARLSCIINAPRVPIATITADDLIGQTRAPKVLTRRNRINGITPTYRSEAHFWELVPGDLVSDAAMVAADGGERTREREYRLVQVETGEDASQPIQLAGYDLENAREASPISMALKLRWIGYRPGDCVTCDIAESGIEGKQLLITGRSLDPSTGAVKLTFRTEDPTKHGRVFARTGDLPPTTDFYRPTNPGDNAFASTARAAHLIVRQSVAYPIDSTADTFTIEAFTATIDDGRVLTFPAQTISGLDDGSTYLVLWNLDTSAFEAVPAPAIEQVASDRYVIVREMTTSNADGTYPANPTAPGGDGGGGYGGGGCPIITARILLANAGRTGPGETIAAGDIAPGMWVWTQRETEVGSDRFGAYRVAYARTFRSPLYAVDGRPLTSPSHLWGLDDGWSRSDMLGTPAGQGDVVAMGVAEACTYVIVGEDGRWHLSHNKRAEQPDAS